MVRLPNALCSTLKLQSLPASTHCHCPMLCVLYVSHWDRPKNGGLGTKYKLKGPMTVMLRNVQDLTKILDGSSWRYPRRRFYSNKWFSQLLQLYLRRFPISTKARKFCTHKGSREILVPSSVMTSTESLDYTRCRSETRSMSLCLPQSTVISNFLVDFWRPSRCEKQESHTKVGDNVESCDGYFRSCYQRFPNHWTPGGNTYDQPNVWSYIISVVET